MKLIEFLKKEEKKALSLGKEESAVVLYMMHVTGYSATELYVHMNDKVSDEVVRKFETEFKKYLYENKPIQYIIGNVNFCGNLLEVNENVLIPLVCNKIQEALERLSRPMQLAIIGKISSSKSTLVNAVLGKEEVVRTGQMEETFNVSWLK